MSQGGHSDDQLGPGKIIYFEKTHERCTLLKKLSSASSQIIVYKAQLHVPDEPPSSGVASQTSNNDYVVLKMIPMSLGDECYYLRLEYRKSLKSHIHHNVYGVRGWFNSTDGYVGVVMPYMDEGSLRHIISTRFNNGGLPEDCIAVAFAQALLGLSYLHAKRHVHNHISAANIFVDRVSVKLAYEVSMYEHEPDEINQHHGPEESSTSALDLKEITKWGAAPEVYGMEDSAAARAARSARGHAYEQKADIWLVGITALELAYGCLPVANRQDLEAIIKNITKKQKLPSFEKLKEITEKAGKKISKGKKLKMYLQKKVKLALRTKKKRVFSEDFGEMVAKCLAENPEERPTAYELLQTNFIKNSKDINHFLRVLSKTLLSSTGVLVRARN